MLDIEIISNYVGQAMSIAISLWIFFKHNRNAGALLTFSFIIWSAVGVIMVHFPDVVSFEHKVENGVFIDMQVVAPIWYKIIMGLRAIASLTLPLGIFLLVKNALSKNI